MKKIAVLAFILSLAISSFAQTDFSLPAGTAVKVKLETTLATFTSKAGDRFSGRVMDALVVGDKEVIPVGSTVQGRVTKVNEPRRIIVLDVAKRVEFVPGNLLEGIPVKADLYLLKGVLQQYDDASALAILGNLKIVCHQIAYWQAMLVRDHDIDRHVIGARAERVVVDRAVAHG